MPSKLKEKVKAKKLQEELEVRGKPITPCIWYLHDLGSKAKKKAMDIDWRSMVNGKEKWLISPSAVASKEKKSYKTDDKGKEVSLLMFINNLLML